MDDAKRDEALEALNDIEGHLEEVWHGIRHSDHIHDQLVAIKHLLAEPDPPEKTLTTVSDCDHLDQGDWITARDRDGDEIMFRAWARRSGAVVAVSYGPFPDALRGVGRIDIDAPLYVGSTMSPAFSGDKRWLSLPGWVQYRNVYTAQTVFDNDPAPDRAIEGATAFYNDKLLPTLKVLAAYIEANFRLADEE